MTPPSDFDARTLAALERYVVDGPAALADPVVSAAVEAHPDFARSLQQACAEWSQVSPEASEESLRAARQRLRKGDVPPSTHQLSLNRAYRRRLGGSGRWTLRIGIVVGLTLVLGIQLAISFKRQETERVYRSHVGQLLAVTLRDGSRVILAPQTRLAVEPDFGRARRTLRLTGEAYFDVRTTTGAPFIVRTARIATTVLGTTFTVRHYAEDLSTQIAVVTGKVQTGRQSPIVLAAGDVARVNDSTATMVSTGDARAYTAWTTGQLVFERTPIHELLAKVGRWYGYRFWLADTTLATQTVSMVLDTSNAHEAMLLLQSLLDVTMTFDGTNVTLTPRHGATSVRRKWPNITSSPTTEVGR